MNRLLALLGASLLTGCVFVDSQEVPSTNGSSTTNTNNGTNLLNNLNNVLNNVTNNVTNNGTSCVPETDQELCENDGKDCSAYTVTDRCGVERTVECGACVQGVGCGESIPNVCGCPCTIDGECYARVANPNNPCEQCRPEQSTTSWSPRPMGSPCETGNRCDEGASCNADGVCVGRPKVCNEGGACKNGACNPITGECDYVNKPENAPCGDDGLPCTQDLCMGGVCHTLASNTCVIDGMCVNGGTLKDPGNCSMACNPTIDPYKWTMAAPNTQCDPDPESCAIGACTNTGQCLTTNNSLGFNPKDGRACTQNNCNGMCYAGTCQSMGSSMYTQCIEANTCYDAGDIRPTNPCQWCNTGSQVMYVTWINVADGTPCLDGIVQGTCQNGMCQ
ncbi:MAG: hypothetical protein R3E66_05830 [bacterium]